MVNSVQSSSYEILNFSDNPVTLQLAPITKYNFWMNYRPSLELLISTSDVGSFIYENQCLIPQVKLSPLWNIEEELN